MASTDQDAARRRQAALAHRPARAAVRGDVEIPTPIGDGCEPAAGGDAARIHDTLGPFGEAAAQALQRTLARQRATVHRALCREMIARAADENIRPEEGDRPA